jgi:hypothetical protein
MGVIGRGSGFSFFLRVRVRFLGAGRLPVPASMCHSSARAARRAGYT